MPVPLSLEIPAVPPSGASNSNYSFSYVNGYYIYLQGWFGLVTARINLWYATDPTGTWTQVAQPMAVGATTGTNRPQAVQTCGEIQFDGTYYFYGCTQRAGNSGTYQSQIIYATDPAGPWTALAVDATVAPGKINNQYINSIRYTNGRYVISGGHINNGAWIAYSDSLFGPYTIRTASSIQLNASQVWYLHDCLYLDGYYYMCGYNMNAQLFRRCSASTMDSWTEIALPVGWYTSGSYLNQMYVEDGRLFYAQYSSTFVPPWNLARGSGTPISGWDYTSTNARHVSTHSMPSLSERWFRSVGFSAYLSDTIDGPLSSISVSTSGSSFRWASSGTSIVMAGQNGQIRYLKFASVPLSTITISGGMSFPSPVAYGGSKASSPYIQLIGAVDSCSYMTTEEVDTGTLRINLWKPSRSGPKKVAEEEISAFHIIDYGQSRERVVLRTLSDPQRVSGALPGHVHVISTNKAGTALVREVYEVPNKNYTYYGWDQLGKRSIFVSGDGLQVGFFLYAATTQLAVHNLADFSVVANVNLTSLLSATYYQDNGEAGYVVGMPRENRFLFVTTDWADQYNSVNVGQHQLHLCNMSGAILSSVSFNDPFASFNRPVEKWAMHDDGSATYARTMPAGWSELP